MVWVSVDGLEGAGKTTLVQSLTELFDTALVLCEFSSGFAGRALGAAVKLTPHHLSPSAVAQSLFFLGEYVEKIEEARSAIGNPESLVITDRGLLSKRAYQAAVLRPAIGCTRTDALLSICLAGLPVPDMTIWLNVNPAIAKERVQQRGAPKNIFNLEFMRTTAEEFILAAKDCRAVELDTNTMSARDICNAAYLKIIARWPHLKSQI